MDEQKYTFADGVNNVTSALLDVIGARNKVRAALRDDRADTGQARASNTPATGGTGWATANNTMLWLVGGIALIVLLRKG